MKYRNFAIKYGFGAFALAASLSAHATTPMEDIFASVDFSSVGAWVALAGVAIIGITMAFKAIDLGKRGVKKA